MNIHARIETPKPTEERVPQDFETLPFIKRNGPEKSGFDYWAVETTGSYSDDCDLGRRYAEQFLELAPTNGTMTILGMIVVDMIRKGPGAKGIVIGFMRKISTYAFTGVLVEKEVYGEIDPDRELLALGNQLLMAQVEYGALSVDALTDQEHAAEVYKVNRIVDQIAAISARTIAGLRVKASAYRWHADPVRPPIDCFETIRDSIIADLMGEPIQTGVPSHRAEAA